MEMPNANQTFLSLLQATLKERQIFALKKVVKRRQKGFVSFLPDFFLTSVG